ncbi:hypothetical protein B0H63DRAFT_525917 [Podospora didyma]|uniref:Cyanovirin-N domain-containing protein n=1 Tax=Podospora didyma TaxID=330526 RepID=A0AAE0KED2_9PEZI|nr:hypothetical protein B0H63DRAFT_525917 [Podospora didyma]
MWLPSILSPALLLLQRGGPDTCTSFPSWTVKDFNSTTSDTVGSGGAASFTLINNLSGAVDNLRCSLQVNYRCIITGTPSDKNLTVNVAVRAGALTLLLEETVDCPGRTTPLHVIGNGDLELDCTWDENIGGKVSCGLLEEVNVIQGDAVELAPDPWHG